MILYYLVSSNGVSTRSGKGVHLLYVVREDIVVAAKMEGAAHFASSQHHWNPHGVVRPHVRERQLVHGEPARFHL